MKRNNRTIAASNANANTNGDTATAVVNGNGQQDQKQEPGLKSAKKNEKNNGNSALGSAPDLTIILASLQTMRDGDFSVRLPGSWTGIEGKIAATFNEIV